MNITGLLKYDFWIRLFVVILSFLQPFILFIQKKTKSPSIGEVAGGWLFLMVHCSWRQESAWSQGGFGSGHT